MSRSRRDQRSYLPEVQEELRLREELKKAALPTAAYIRRSVIDVEEASIENQIAIVHSYIKENPELNLLDTYVDNGISGTTFDRPEWKRMMRDVQSGRISCIVVKDLSRFARDYIEAGTYIENIFPKLGVRFIAITDNYDNTAGDTIEASMMVPAKNILNDLYARDASRKQRLVQEKMRKEKKVSINSCPYGYSLVEKQAIPNPEQVPVVRAMFLWADLGVSITEMTDRLDFMGIPTKKNGKWDQKQVRELLINPFFIGNLAAGKTNWHHGEKVRMPEEKWTIIPDHHEPIIEEELFYRVSERLRPKLKDSKELPDLSEEPGPQDYPWKGMVCCGVCGRPMKAENTTFICGRHKGIRCSEKQLDRSPGITVKEMETLIYRRCRKFRKELADILVLINSANRKDGINERLTKRATAALVEKKKEEANVNRLYDDYCEGLMDETDYMNLSQRYEKRLKIKRDALNEILSDQRKLKSSMEAVKEFAEAFEQVNRMDEKQAERFIERIEVTDEVTLDVRFKHQDEIDLLMDYVKGKRK